MLGVTLIQLAEHLIIALIDCFILHVGTIDSLDWDQFTGFLRCVKRNGLNVFGYLSYLMLVLPSWGKTPSEEQLDSIMPWSAALPETCHRTYHQIVENEAEVK